MALTRLLSQWAETNGQAFAWASADDADNDPKVLFSYVAEALDAIEPVGGRVFDALASPGLRHLLTYAVPHVTVQARIELARVHLALADVAGARTLMREVDELLRRRPGLGTLVDEAAAPRVQLARQRRSSVPGASALTAAELRLLPLLATHLSFPEIAVDLFLSPNTVKSQAISMYRKLGVTSRSQAVARAQDLGLLDG